MHGHLWVRGLAHRTCSQGGLRACGRQIFWGFVTTAQQCRSFQGRQRPWGHQIFIFFSSTNMYIIYALGKNSDNHGSVQSKPFTQPALLPTHRGLLGYLFSVESWTGFSPPWAWSPACRTRPQGDRSGPSAACPPAVSQPPR